MRGLFIFLFVLGVSAQQYTGFETMQPDAIIKIVKADTTGLQGKIHTTWQGAWVVCKGYMASPKCDTGLVVEINPWSEPDTNFWVTLPAPPGFWMGQIFRRIRALNTTVPLDSLRCSVRPN
jgi:hypothetical protein